MTQDERNAQYREWVDALRLGEPPIGAPTLPGFYDPRITEMLERAVSRRIVRVDPAAAERARIIAKLQELKPPHRPRTHGDWARGWREAGELAMFDKIMRAISQPDAKGGE